MHFLKIICLLLLSVATLSGPARAEDFHKICKKFPCNLLENYPETTRSANGTCTGISCTIRAAWKGKVRPGLKLDANTASKLAFMSAVGEDCDLPETVVTPKGEFPFLDPEALTSVASNTQNCINENYNLAKYDTSKDKTSTLDELKQYIKDRGIALVWVYKPNALHMILMYESGGKYYVHDSNLPNVYPEATFGSGLDGGTSLTYDGNTFGTWDLMGEGIYLRRYLKGGKLGAELSRLFKLYCH